MILRVNSEILQLIRLPIEECVPDSSECNSKKLQRSSWYMKNNKKKI